MKKNRRIQLGSLAMTAAVIAASVPMSMNAYADAAELILSEQKHSHSAVCYCKGGGSFSAVSRKQSRTGMMKAVMQKLISKQNRQVTAEKRVGV